MKRRDFFVAGTAIATTGVAGAAVAATTTTGAISPSPRTTPSIFEFGARGDGVTDDGPAFSKALQVAAAEGRKIIVPGYTYGIGSTVAYTSIGNATRQWGLECQGATLKSAIVNGSDVVRLVSRHVVRYFTITGGLTIKGTGSDGHGLRFSVPASGGMYFYNATLDRLAIEGVGGHGLVMEGNVFENQISNSFFQDCKKNGATFAHYKGGICSSINLVGCYFNQNGQYGMEATNFDGPYGGANDIRVFGGYCRENRSFGFRFKNGTAPGASIMQVGFENNCKSMSPGDPNGAHVYALTRMTMRDCTGYNESGGATYLLRGWFSALTVLDGCNQSAGGAMRETGKTRLVQVNGSSAGHVLLRGCSGGVAVAGSTGCTWQAENCTGDSPLGALDIRQITRSV